MRFDTTSLVATLALGLSTMLPALGWSQSPCVSGESVIAKPVDTGGASQFTQVPASPPAPSFTAPYRWMLVDDFMENSAGGAIHSGFVNTTGGTVKTELFLVRNANMEDAGIQFASCTVRAQLATTSAGTAMAYLVVAGHDGTASPVVGTSLQEVRRAMTEHPVAHRPWTSDDLYYGTSIGVKNAVSSVGVGIESIIMECK